MLRNNQRNERWYLNDISHCGNIVSLSAAHSAFSYCLLYIAWQNQFNYIKYDFTNIDKGALPGSVILEELKKDSFFSGEDTEPTFPPNSSIPCSVMTSTPLSTCFEFPLGFYNTNWVSLSLLQFNNPKEQTNKQTTNYYSHRIDYNHVVIKKIQQYFSLS